MNLYRAHYVFEGRLTPKRITFAAADATSAHEIAQWFEIPGEHLLTVKLVRPLTWQLDLDVGEAT